MGWKQIHVGRRAVMGAALPALVVVAAISVVMLRTAADPVLRTISLGFWAGPLVVDESAGRAFVNKFDPGGPSRIAMLNAATGALARTITMPGWAGTLAVDEQTARLVAATSDGVRVLDARSGRLPRTIPIGPATTAVAVDGRRGRVYVTNAGAVDASGNFVAPGTLSVLDERSGRILRSVAVGVNPGGLVLDRRAGRLFVVNAGNYNLVQPADPWAWVPHWLRHWLPFLPQQAPPPRIPGSVTVLDTLRL